MRKKNPHSELASSPLPVVWTYKKYPVSPSGGITENSGLTPSQSLSPQKQGWQERPPPSASGFPTWRRRFQNQSLANSSWPCSPICSQLPQTWKSKLTFYFFLSLFSLIWKAAWRYTERAIYSIYWLTPQVPSTAKPGTWNSIWVFHVGGRTQVLQLSPAACLNACGTGSWTRKLSWTQTQAVCCGMCQMPAPVSFSKLYFQIVLTCVPALLSRRVQVTGKFPKGGIHIVVGSCTPGQLWNRDRFGTSALNSDSLRLSWTEAEAKCLQYFLKNPSKVLLYDIYKSLTVLFQKLKCPSPALEKSCSRFSSSLLECKHCFEWKELKARILSLEILFLNKRRRKSFFSWLLLIIQVKVSDHIQLNGKQKSCPSFSHRTMALEYKLPTKMK